MRESGYGKVSLQPSRILESKGFQEELAKIDDGAIVKKWYEWALSGADKRTALDAGKEIMKLKNRYPDIKVKFNQFQEELNEFKDGFNRPETTNENRMDTVPEPTENTGV